jgi:amidohydrolase
MSNNIKSLIDEVLPEVLRLRRAIHSHPELGYQEFNTTKTVYDFLAANGVTARTFEDITGVVAEIDSGREHTVGFRADIDALPIREQTGADFSSRVSGVMHACGHDMHTAIAAGLAVVLNRLKGELPVNVKVIFQPAEECNPEGGAKKIIEKGVLDNLSFLMGLHVWPEIPVGEIGIRPGYLMAASDKFSVSIFGKKSHAAEPHKGIDAIAAAIQAASLIKSIVSQEINPLEPAVISIGELNSFGRYNIICDEAHIKGTIRTFDPALREQIHGRIQDILRGIALSKRITYELNLEKGYNVVRNDPRLTREFIRNAETLLGAHKVNADIQPTLVGEDFSFYGDYLPALYFFLGVGKGSPLHSDTFLPPEEAVPAALLAVSGFFSSLDGLCLTYPILLKQG